MNAIPIEKNRLHSSQKAHAALNAYFNIVEKAWNLDVAAQKKILGIQADSTFYKFKKEKNGTLSPDILERISYILGIYKDLHLLLPDEQAANEWIKKANQAIPFGGRSALDRMLSGRVADLFVVRQYLDAQRG